VPPHTIEGSGKIGEELGLGERRIKWGIGVGKRQVRIDKQSKTSLLV